MVTLRYLLYAAGVVAVLSLLAAVGSFLLMVWAALQVAAIVLGLGFFVAYLIKQACVKD